MNIRRYKEIETDSQTDREADRQINRQTHRITANWKKVRQTKENNLYRYVPGDTVRWTDRQTDRQTDRRPAESQT